MRVIGFNFEKISAEKLSKNSGEIKVKSNIDVSEIKESKNGFFKSEEELVGIKFSFSLNYEPDFAKISFEGGILFSIDSKESKEILKQWNEKKMPENFQQMLFNLIWKKCTLKALQLEEELNIPLHTPLQNLQIKKKEE